MPCTVNFMAESESSIVSFIIAKMIGTGDYDTITCYCRFIEN